ncbi:MAG: hypothetical protein ACYDH9_11185 [Limisphaerales bacterium]
MAELLKQEFGIEPSRVNGGFQELSVWVGDQPVARKKWFRFPKDEALVAAVREVLGLPSR